MTERPLAEKVEELRNKINLLEGDRKAYYENSYYTQKQNKEKIGQLRKENKDLRKQLKDRLSADDHVINQAFQDRPVERAALSNKTGRDAIQTMDYKVSDTKKKLNALKHMTAVKQRKLDELQQENKEMEQDAEEAKATEEGESYEGRRLRDLENKMDKTNMKLKEAEHIKRTYEQIKSRLQEDHLSFGNTLDAMEAEIREGREEISELERTAEEANRSKEEAAHKLKKMEETVYTERKRREQEIHKLKSEADEKRLQYEKMERRQAQRDSTQDQGPERTSSSLGDSQQEKITDLQEAFKRIKEATGVSDLNEVVIRFENQGSTREHLEELKKDSEKETQRLRAERDTLKTQFDDVKYSGECKLSSGQKILENYQTQLRREEEDRAAVEQELESASKVLVQCKAGVDHLHEKLSHIKVARSHAAQAQIDPSSDAYVLDVLGKCEERLLKLMAELEKEDVEAELKAMRAEEFNQQVESKLPQHNVRISLAGQSREKSYDDDSDSAEDDGEVLSRAAVKKQSQQLIDQKTKKRVARKKKTKK
uniref:Coiled-coil domain-containing protein 151 n=3 Tax=Macrostomum lignano TaxID=282301 RepID=A0A1I8IHX6_9PLAT